MIADESAFHALRDGLRAAGLETMPHAGAMALAELARGGADLVVVDGVGKRIAVRRAARVEAQFEVQSQ